jgi:acyl CoA:acetate/3-ketoacid CoA transferase beta subunit
MRPDVAFVHAAAGDRYGNVIASPPYSEGFWGALGAKAGVIVTVDHLVDAAFCRGYAEWVRIPPYRVLAVCHEPFGAHPQPSYVAARGLDFAAYGDDFEQYELWRRMTRDSKLFAEFSRHVLDAEDGAFAYREFVGQDRLDALRAERWASQSELPPRSSDPASDATRERGLTGHQRLVFMAARCIAERVEEGRYRTILAGIGSSFAAARLAKRMLDARGIGVEVMVETGLGDIECGASAHPYLLAAANMAQARRLSSVEDVLGTLTCGAYNECLGVLGAAEIDGAGNINSTRLASGELLVGSGGANDIASSCREVVAVVKCERTRLVPRVHYVTSRGKSVLRIATERCVLARAAPADAWAVAGVYQGPGSLEDAVRGIEERCGFPLDRTRTPCWVEPPNASDLASLRAVAGDGRRGEA